MNSSTRTPLVLYPGHSQKFLSGKRQMETASSSFRSNVTLLAPCVQHQGFLWVRWHPLGSIMPKDAPGSLGRGWGDGGRIQKEDEDRESRKGGQRA